MSSRTGLGNADLRKETVFKKQRHVKNILPCWKSVLPQPLISRASPVKAMLWSSSTRVAHPSVCPGVVLTVRCWRWERSMGQFKAKFSWNWSKISKNRCILYTEQKRKEEGKVKHLPHKSKNKFKWLSLGKINT